jgi:hypothetical protein
MIWEACTSKIVGHFNVWKTVTYLERYVYWPKLKEEIDRFIIGCMLCCTNKPSNKKHII